ncbi:MAG: hypothetical protein AABY22_08725 [Nanoarchaeota archaeon]
MAQKNWKKTITKRDEIEFRRKQYLRNRYDNEIAIILGINDIWHLHVPNTKVRHFKTKSQALRYAKAYMRKH